MDSASDNVKEISHRFRSEFDSKVNMNTNDQANEEDNSKKITVFKKNQIRPQYPIPKDKLRNSQGGLLATKCKPVQWHIEKPTRTICSECGEQTENVFRPVSGQTTYLWAIFLLFTTGICCPLPFFLDNCKDKQVLCIRCCQIKNIKRTECCSCI